MTIHYFARYFTLADSLLLSGKLFLSHYCSLLFFSGHCERRIGRRCDLTLALLIMLLGSALDFHYVFPLACAALCAFASLILITMSPLHQPLNAHLFHCLFPVSAELQSHQTVSISETPSAHRGESDASEGPAQPIPGRGSQLTAEALSCAITLFPLSIFSFFLCPPHSFLFHSFFNPANRSLS